ncbi:MAG: hypothetical protein NC453_19830 [Muribaculum sp.]|nr:hypothetical protein [Muribaculum sp.]
MLEAYGIKNAGKYLAKIFNLEMAMPQVPAKDLRALFIKEMKTMGMRFEDDLLREWSSVLQNYLFTFRDIKRFCREFVLVYTKMEKEIHTDEFLDHDLFLLQLLQYTDKEKYRQLSMHHPSLVSWALDSRGRWKISLIDREGDKTLIYNDTRLILKRLFDPAEDDDRSVKYIENFKRYFTHRQSEYTVTRKEFLDWAQDPDEESASGKFRSLSEKTGKRRSIVFRFSCSNIQNLTQRKLQEAATYLLTLHFDSVLSREELKLNLGRLLTRIHRREDIDLTAFYGAIDSHLGAERLRKWHRGNLKISEILQMLRQQIPAAKDNIRKLEISNMQRYLEEKAPAPEQMADPNSQLNAIYQNSMEWTVETLWDENGDPVQTKQGETPLITTLESYYKAHPSEDSATFLEKLFCYLTQDPYTGEIYSEYLPEEEQQSIATTTFGTPANYSRYLAAAFPPKNPAAEE